MILTIVGLVLAYTAIGTTVGFTVLVRARIGRWTDPEGAALGAFILWPLVGPLVLITSIVRFLDKKADEIVERHRK